MKLCCFVILVFISVIFTVGGEWGKRGIGRVNSLPMPSTNQNEVKSNLYSQQLLTKRFYSDKELERKFQNVEEQQEGKHPNPTNSTNQTKQSNNKGKDSETPNAASQNSESANAKKLEEEAQTISRVIVVLGSLGASLLLVAIAIAVLYWKVRRQQKLVKSVKDIKVDENNINNGKGDEGVGVGEPGEPGEPGDGETNINPSDDSDSLFNISKKSNVINSNPSGGSNNGFSTEVVGDKVNNETPESPYIHHNIQLQLSPPPTAPPAEKVIGDNNLDNLDIVIGSNSNLSAPPLVAPPAYTPTAPPIYALPHIPIDGSVREMILYTDGDTYQRPNPHNLETNNNNGISFIGTPSVAWTPTNDALYQQSNPTIIQPNPSSATNLNSSFNSHENNDGNDRPTHQRQTI